MNLMQEQVAMWMAKFGQKGPDSLSIPDEKTKMLRQRLIQEESAELFAAIDGNDLVGIADGIADLLYVVFGTATAYGIDAQKVFDEVHRSNMTKLWPDGKPHRDAHGKVIKPNTYSPPDLAPILETMK